MDGHFRAKLDKYDGKKKLFKVLISANTEIQILVINPCFIPKMIIQDAQEIFCNSSVLLTWCCTT